jgi:dienelactone hydrolase
MRELPARALGVATDGQRHRATVATRSIRCPAPARVRGPLGRARAALNLAALALLLTGCTSLPAGSALDGSTPDGSTPDGSTPDGSTLAGSTRTRASNAVPVANEAPAMAASPRRVLIPTSGLSSSPAPLVAWRFAPAGAAPHPAVVMLHGCGGAYARNGRPNARHRMWGRALAAQGYQALMLDSFTSRGLHEICTVPFRARTLRESDRVGDAYAALTWLRTQPDVDPTRIALLGWSHGGGVTLAAIADVPAGTTGFRAAVAFYPGCSVRNRHVAAYHPAAPVLVLMGESDDWTPVAPCRSLVSAVAARGEPMTLVTWPGTFHDFDNPALRQPHLRRDVPNGVHPGKGVTTAPNPLAREEAKRRVSAFLADAMR